MDTKTTDLEKLTFEAALDQLQKLVKMLESGDLPLEQGLKLFEEGVILSRVCQERLSASEQKVQQLLSSSGQWDNFKK